MSREEIGMMVLCTIPSCWSSLKQKEKETREEREKSEGERAKDFPM